MVLWSTIFLHWHWTKGKRHWALRSCSSIHTMLHISTAVLALAFGSIATMALAPHATNSLHSHAQSNYEGVDAVSAITGLSNGYATPSFMQSYYQLRTRNAVPEQHQQLYRHDHHARHPLHPFQPSNSDLFDMKHSDSGRILLHSAGQYSSREGDVTTPDGVPTNALEIYSMPESGFMPTALTAAGQHYATSFAATEDKNNAFATSPATGTLDLGHSSEAATSYSNMVTAFNDNTSVGSTHRLHGRLSEVAEVAGESNRNMGGDGEGFNSFASDYVNYAAGIYNEDQINDHEHQQHFVNYFTPPTYAPGIGDSYSRDSASSQQFLPLTNYPYQHNGHNQQHPHIHTRSSGIPLAQSTKMSTSPPHAPYYHTFNHASNSDASANYQKWNLVDQPPRSDYYISKDMQDRHQQQKLKENEQGEVTEPIAAETSYVINVSSKKGKSKSKRSDPQQDTFGTHSTAQISDDLTSHYQTHNLLNHEISHSHLDNTETVEYQQQQLEELQKQLQQQQHQFVTLQHQLIDHDQQLQIQKQHAQYQTPTSTTLPPGPTTVHHHTPLSLQAISGTPLSKHTHVVRTIPIAHRQQVYVPQKQEVNFEVPNPIITTISKPTPIQIPVSKTVAIPDIKEVKIPIEKVNPYPVERPIPYIVEKRVPYTVEKQVAKPYYYSVPIKVPIVHTVVHKVRTIHPKHYQTQNHIPSPIHYKGHVRHVHHGLGQSQYGGHFL